MKTKSLLKKHILTSLSNCEWFVSSQALLYSITNSDSYNQNLVLSTKKIGSACGELVRKGKLIKKVLLSGVALYILTGVWLKKTADDIKEKIPFDFPEVKVKIVKRKKDNILEGQTRIEKRHEKLTITITIYVSYNLFARKNIYQAIRMVLIHEFSHVISPFHPDEVMKAYFPEVFKVWKKVEELEGLKCSAEIKEIK